MGAVTTTASTSTSTPLAGDPCPLGHPTAPGQQFCPLCGTSLVQSPVDTETEADFAPGLGLFERLSPSKRTGAGASSRRKHEAMRKAWLREARGRFWMMVSLVGCVLAALTAWTVSHPHGSLGYVMLGFVIGVGVTGLAALRQMPPGYISNWQDGAWGEEWTAKELRPLVGQGWTVLHDQRDRRGDGKGNFDHVVVGTAGVFLLDSKRWQGSTTIEQGVPTLRRHEDPDLPATVHESLPRRQRRAAARLNSALKDANASAWVTPVVVIWGGFPEGSVVNDGVTYVRGDLIRGWLTTQPAKLSPERRAAVTSALQRALVRA